MEEEKEIDEEQDDEYSLLSPYEGEELDDDLPLINAAKRGDLTTVQSLLDQGEDVDETIE